jgi:hypothetical protein
MALLSRVLQKIFGSTGGTSEFGRIGSEAAGAPTTTKDLDNIQSLAQYLQGLYAITASANEPPRIQDINALYFLITSQLSYIFQNGIAEYLSTEEYYIGSIVRDSNEDVYISLTGTGGSPNQGNTPSSSPSDWKLLVGKDGALNKSVTNEINTMSSKSVLVDDDVLLIEDSEDSYNKKKISYSSFKIENFKNYIINPDGMIIQRGSAFDSTTDPANNDDTYLLDRWILLSDGNDIVDVSRSADAPAGATFSMKHVVATANKKFGILQIVENREAIDIIGSTCSVAFEAKTGSGVEIENIRVGVLAWDGALDNVTSDVVSIWGSEGADPTLVSNWTYENTPENIALTTNWTEYTIEGISLDTPSTTNIALFFWIDDTDASVNDELYISKVRLTQGNKAIAYAQRYFTTEIMLCKRFYQKSYNFDVAPGTITNDGEYILFLDGLNNAARTVKGIVFLPIVSRTNNYTITTYDNVPNKDKIATSAGDNQTPTFERKSDISFSVSGTNGGGSTQAKIEFQWTIDDEL